jgi:hypothetical protein
LTESQVCIAADHRQRIRRRAQRRTGIATSESAAAAPAAATFESKVFETGAENERAAVASENMVSIN